MLQNEDFLLEERLQSGFYLEHNGGRFMMQSAQWKRLLCLQHTEKIKRWMILSVHQYLWMSFWCQHQIHVAPIWNFEQDKERLYKQPLSVCTNHSQYLRYYRAAGFYLSTQEALNSHSRHMRSLRLSHTDFLHVQKLQTLQMCESGFRYLTRQNVKHIHTLVQGSVTCNSAVLLVTLTKNSTNQSKHFKGQLEMVLLEV